MSRSIYIVTEQGASALKIGIAGDPLRRLAMLQIGQARDLILAWSVIVDRAEDVERAAHKILRDRRVRGEWFNCTVREAKAAIELAMAGLDVEAVGPESKSRAPEVPSATVEVAAVASPLRRWRTERSLTLTEVADQLGCSHSTLLRMAEGQSRARPALEARIAALTGLSLEALAEPGQRRNVIPFKRKDAA